MISKVARIRNLTNYQNVSSTLGIVYHPVTQYVMGGNGEQAPEMVTYISTQAVPDFPGVAVDRYTINPGSDDHASRVRLSFRTDPVVACVTLGELQAKFGAAAKSVAIPGGWGLAYDWTVRDERRFATTVRATFGTSATQCSTLIEIRQTKTNE